MSTQLHRGVGENAAYFNYAVSESVAMFRDPFNEAGFRARLAVSYIRDGIARLGQTCGGHWRLR